MLDGSIKTPDIRDAERLQGFGTDWTAPAVDDPNRRNGPRWKLVGNAVSVPLAQWVGRRLAEGAEDSVSRGTPIENGGPWPKAAYGRRGSVHEVDVGMWPERRPYRHLDRFLRYPMLPLSRRALAGFLHRTSRSTLRFPDGLLDAVHMALDEHDLEDDVA
jgi:DNA (cytosine-5)-methyltransferase 1